MSVTSEQSLSPSHQRLEGALLLGGQDYPFVLYHQPVHLGTAGEANYYYMLPGDLRGSDPVRERSNFRSCIGYWWAATRENGLENDWEQQRHYVMAICYALVNRNKSLQDVYLDAFPRPGSIDPEELSIPEETQRRIRSVIDRRDRAGVKEELDLALAVYQPSRGDSLGFQRAFRIWADRGVEAYRQTGREGVIRWLQKVDGWMAAYRKRCPPRVRSFINIFSYQAKCSFYLCYANFWASLVPWLQVHHGLDRLSTRLLRLWHSQAQPAEIPHGRTAGGLVYPTQRGVELQLPDSQGRRIPHRFTWRTEHVGPEVIPDVFSGQVLSLHPLTWVLFADPALCDILGLFLSTWEFDRVTQGGPTHDCILYWETISVILTAAHMYRLARDRSASRRGIQERSTDNSPPLSGDDSPPRVTAFLDDYLASRGRRCECGAAYHCDQVEQPDDEQPRRTIPVRCSKCRRKTSIHVAAEDVERFLLGE